MADLSRGCLWSPARKTSGASLAKRGRSEGIDRQTMLMLHSRMLHIRGSARSSRGRDEWTVINKWGRRAYMKYQGCCRGYVYTSI
jgi:hypothetical protein